MYTSSSADSDRMKILEASFILWTSPLDAGLWWIAGGGGDPAGHKQQ